MNKIEFDSKKMTAVKQTLVDAYNMGLNVANVANEMLEEVGFDKEDRRTKYLAALIQDAYYEKSIYDDEYEYFNLDDANNEHYSYVGSYYNVNRFAAFRGVKESISESLLFDKSINEVVYGIRNNIVKNYESNIKSKNYANA